MQDLTRIPAAALPTQPTHWAGDDSGRTGTLKQLDVPFVHIFLIDRLVADSSQELLLVLE